MNYQFSPDTTFPDALKTQPAALGPAQAPRAGRFAPTRGLRLVRAAYGALCRVAPALAAWLAYAQLSTPSRTAPRDWHVGLRRQAVARRLPSGNGEIAVMEWGKGPAVLLVHGWASHATHMGRMVGPLVSAGYRVVAFDAPAHGDSSGDTTDMVQFASAIAAVAADVGPLHAVVGHSFGAAMALYAARDWGVQPGRMVLFSSFDHCNWFINAFGDHVGLTPQVLERVRQRLVRLYGGRLDWSRMSVVDMARVADFPALVVHDEDDEEIPFEHALALAAVLPRGELKRTRGYGHHLVLRSASVIDGVVRFIAQKEAA
jgi:pimeloyl-ACP methyl ester carboxylesterase